MAPQDLIFCKGFYLFDQPGAVESQISHRWPTRTPMGGVAILVSVPSRAHTRSTLLFAPRRQHVSCDDRPSRSGGEPKHSFAKSWRVQDNHNNDNGNPVSMVGPAVSSYALRGIR